MSEVESLGGLSGRDISVSAATYTLAIRPHDWLSVESYSLQAFLLGSVKSLLRQMNSEDSIINFRVIFPTFTMMYP